MASIVTLSLLTGALFIVPDDVGAAPDVPFTFGIGAGFTNEQESLGVKPDYQTFWVGPWTLKHGWGGPGNQMVAMRDAGVTPAIHFYYWGDDITPSCVENGCYSSLHSSWKDRAGWQQLAQGLVDNLNAKMGGEPVVIFLETEFNKGGIERYEPFDGYLAEKAQFIKQGYPNAHIVIALGNWNSAAWGNFDRTAAASDSVGIQGMRGSTRDSASSYDNLYEATLAGARTAKSLFGKPVFIQDLALSSYPTADYETKQAAELKQFFTGIDALREAGVHALIYRTWRDNPNMDLNNYYGQAERHWGFTVAYSGAHKPAASVWIEGVKAVRAGTTSPGPGPSPSLGPTQPAAFDARFTPSANGNEWWIETKVSASNTIEQVEVRVNSGSWTTLPATSWGTYAKSVHAPKGASVVFRATDAYGQVALSGTYAWLMGTAPTNVPATFAASFAPSSNVNEWWVETRASASNGISSVHARVEQGSWTALPKTSWGAYAASFHVPKGSSVTFRATDTSGQTALSATYTWMQVTNAAPTARFTQTTDGLTARFDASTSSDPDGQALTYTWDLGDGTSATGVKTTRTYAKPGTYSVTLTVTDGTHTAMTAQSVQAIQPNRAPTASFTADGSDLTVRLDATTSTDPDGDALSYAWSFGDGTTATGPTTTHTYDAGGSYTVTLTVSDGRLDATTSRTLIVTQPNRAPTASFTATAKDLTATFDASASSDADGDALTYTWAFGDGTTGTGKTATRTYAKAGTYTVTLTVSDGKLVSRTWHTVSVAPPAFAPTFRLSENVGVWWVEVYVDGPTQPARVDVAVNGGKWVQLDAKSWGSYAKSMRVTKGSDVVFRATDAHGQTALSGTYKWLRSANEGPVAQFAATTDGLTATFDASGSTDANGDTLQYGWSFGDGTSGNGVKVTRTYTQPGTYSVTLTVSDGKAATTSTQTITVEAAYAASFDVSPNVNQWWVEVWVKAPTTPKTVEVQVNGGSWTTLPQTSWGSYAKSMHVPAGSTVVFRASDASGQTATSAPVTWLR